MFNSNGISAADLAAVTRNDDSTWGGNGIWWIILLFLVFGIGNNGWGNSGAAENYVLASDFATLQRQIDSTSTNTNNLITNNSDQIQRQVTAIGNGISSLGYDQLNQTNGINNAIATSTYDLRNAIQNSDVMAMQNTNAITTGITGLGTQLASCCCNMTNAMNTQFGDLKYSLAEQSCATRQAVADAKTAIIANSDANTRSILDFLTQDKIATLTAENQALKFAASQQAQNAYLVSALTPICGCGCNC